MKRFVGIVVFVFVVALSSQAFAADVYVTKNGKKFHAEGCSLIKSKQTVKIDEAQAVKEGLLPCGKCHKSKMIKVAQGEQQK